MTDTYQWLRKEEIERRYPGKEPDPSDGRDPFEHDRARIIHSVHFRRLQGKTQIFFPAWADFVRTRVTHVIETSQIGRALAINLNLPPSLVEAACLAHDLGHPPFGHSGEEILNELMKRDGGFEGNAQTFRILTRIERKSPEYRGLNLCRATLLATIKYPYKKGSNRSKYLYEDDAKDYEKWLYNHSGKGLIPKSSAITEPHRTLACQLMDWADDIAYSVHDLEDGLISGFLNPSILTNEYVINKIHQNIANAPVKTKPDVARVKAILKQLKNKLGKWTPTPSRGTIREATRYYINEFVNCVSVNKKDPVENSFDYTVEIPPCKREICAVLKAISFEFLINDQRTRIFSSKGALILRRLFELLHDNAGNSAGQHRFLLFPENMRDHLEEASDDQTKLARLLCDYLASMTEGQAIRLYQSIFEASGGSPFDPH